MKVDFECTRCDNLKTAVICNICGKELDIWDKQENFGIHTHVGYGSIYDLCGIDLDLCCGCFDKIFTEHILPSCKINPVTEGCRLDEEEG